MMELRNRRDVEWGVFPSWETDSRFRHAFSTRKGGVSRGNYFSLNLGRSDKDPNSNIEENRHRFFSAIGLELSRVVHAVQVHSAKVAVVDKPAVIENCDGLITDTKDLNLVIGVADCHGVFLISTDRKIAGALHAGWRGTAGHILKNAVHKIQNVYGYSPDDLEIGISPGIGVCCYEVGAEVAQQFPESVLQQRDGSWYLDLNKALILQAEEIGIPRKKIISANRCTSCEPELWYSYRRDEGVTGRMWGVISLKGDK